MEYGKLSDSVSQELDVREGIVRSLADLLSQTVV